MSFIIQEQASPVLFEIGKEEPTGAGGTIDFYLADQDFLYFEGNASANFAIDLAYDAATTLDDALNVDDLVTITLAAKNGSTPYYLTNFQIDGGAGTIAINWEGGLAPTSGNPNSVDYYIFKVLKTSGNAYTVFASIASTTALGLQSENETIVNAAASGTVSLNLASENIVFYTQTATGGFDFDITFATGITLNSVMSDNQVQNCSFKILQGTGSICTGITIDGGSGTTAIYPQDALPSATPGFINEYQLEIVKTGSGAFNIDLNKINLVNPPLSALPFPIETVVVAGGGGGTSRFNAFGPFQSQGCGAGGGAGGFRSGTFTITPGVTYTVTIGAGGAVGSNGTNSSFSSFLESAGGGTGRTPGGSGGGGEATGSSGTTQAGGAGNTPIVSPSQGNPGGGISSPVSPGPVAGAGGGGAGATGSGQGFFVGGPGGNGTTTTITGSPLTLAGGGGGGSGGGGGGTAGTGGTGGGGRGLGATGAALPGTVNTGGGGGGGGTSSTPPSSLGAAGGKGVVIIKSPNAAASTTGSPTVTTSGAFTIYTFNDSGTITF